jgi:hypothetical protein
MAARLDIWNGSQSQVGTMSQPAAPSRVLSLEGAIWLAGSGVVVFLALAGMFGLR